MRSRRYALFHRVDVRPWLCALALGWLSLSAEAAKLPQWGTAGVTNNGGRSFTVNPAAGDLRVPIKNPGGGWQTAGNYGVQNPATGETYNLGANGQVYRATPTGYVTYPFQSKGDLAKDAVIGGLMGCLSGTVVGCVLGAGAPLALAWLANQGVRPNPSNPGSPEFKDPYGGCDHLALPPDLQGQPKDASCGAYTGNFYRPYQNEGGQCVAGNLCDGYGYTHVYTYEGAEATPRPVGWLPKSMDDIAPYLRARPIPPSGVIDEILRSGGDLPLPTGKTVTGPTQIAGPTNSTINPDGSRTVEQTKYNFTTNNTTVTNTTNVTTTTVYNTDNSVRSTSTRTETPTDTVGTGAPPTSTTPTETTPEEPKDPCDTKPNRIGCIEVDVPEGVIPKDSKTITYSEENAFGGGSCPSDKFYTFHSVAMNAKVWDWAATCNYSLAIRGLVMVMATVMAFFIVMPASMNRPS